MSVVFLVKTEVMPHSFGVSEDPVNKMSPKITLFCFSFSPILT